MSCAKKHAGTETMNESNETSPWNNERVKWNKPNQPLLFEPLCTASSSPLHLTHCSLGAGGEGGVSVAEVELKSRSMGVAGREPGVNSPCVTPSCTWAWSGRESEDWQLPCSAPGKLCHTVPLQCSARNQNTIQVIYSLHLKPCTGVTCGHPRFSHTCLLAATAQHLVPGRAWMHPWCQKLCGTPGSCTVEIHRVLGSCPESFPQIPQKVHQPQISIPHLVLAGSIPTVRDPGYGEQHL